jgi:Protein of unknown function (DUF3467)
VAETIWSAPLNPEDRGAAYTNSVNVGVTQWDLTLDFQFATPAPGSSSNPAYANVPLATERVARLVMSPTHAKVLTEALRRAVAEWESRFGPMPDVSVLLPGLGAAQQPQPDPEVGPNGPTAP